MTDTQSLTHSLTQTLTHSITQNQFAGNITARVNDNLKSSLVVFHIQLIKDFLNTTYTERFGEVPGPQLLNFLWSASVSIYLVGGCGGAFCAGWFANKVGRSVASSL
jgi:hypothetical protein